MGLTVREFCVIAVLDPLLSSSLLALLLTF